MGKGFMLLACMYIWCAAISAQSKVSLSGNISDKKGKAVIGAAVLVRPSGNGCVSDNTGFYNIEFLEIGRHTIEISYIGYATIFDTIYIKANKTYDAVIYPLPVKLDEVVITGDYNMQLKREEPLQLEIVNAAYIQQNMAGSLMKTLSELPGMSQIEIGSGNSKPVIRGLGFNRVLVLENGIRHEGQQWGSDHGLEIDQQAVESVHIIKGPASFLYGSDAVGGVIHIKQNSIPEKNTADGSLNFNGRSVNDLWGVSGAVNVRKEAMYFKSRITYNSYADYRVPADSVSIYSYQWPLKNRRLRNTAGNDKALHLSAGLLKKRLTQRFIFSVVDNESGFFANARGLEPRNVDTTLHDKSNRDILLPSQSVKHIKLISQTIYRLQEGSIEMDAGFQNNFRREFGPYNQHGYMPIALPEVFAGDPSLELWLNKNIYTVNTRYNVPLGEIHSLTTGISGEYQHNKTDGWGFIIPPFAQQSAALYVYDKIKYSDKLTLHAGLRYDAGLLKIESYKDWFASPVFSTSGDTWGFEAVTRSEALQKNFHNLSWALGFSYHTEVFSLKTHVGKSFRMPIAKELSTNGINYHNFSYERGNSFLETETAYQLDFGITYSCKKSNFELSPFFNYFPNYIYLTPSYLHDYLYGAGNQIFYYIQNKVVQVGGELLLNQKFSERLTASLNGEYVYARQMSGDKTGFTLPFSPPGSLLISLDYKFKNAGFLHEPYLCISSRLTAPQNRIVPPEQKTEGYYIFNMLAGGTMQFSKQTINIYFQINNLLNRNYMSHTNYYRLIALPEAGRNFTIHIQLPFKINLSNN